MAQQLGTQFEGGADDGEAGQGAGVNRIDQQYLLGPDVLVAPVVVKGATTRKVVFPPGCWRDPVAGRRFDGPVTATVPAPIDRHPYFFRCGQTPFQPPRT